MYKNLIFIGGIHGAGKGTVCSKVSEQIEIKHISASEVLKWSDVSPDMSNKLVKDISDTQDRLITGLKNTLQRKVNYLLDGHFCLFDSNGKINRIPIDTFNKISPILLSVVICDVQVIAERLANRDGKKYDLEILDNMQNIEIEHAHKVSELLKIPLIKIERDATRFINSSKDHFK